MTPAGRWMQTKLEKAHVVLDRGIGGLPSCDGLGCVATEDLEAAVVLTCSTRHIRPGGTTMLLAALPQKTWKLQWFWPAVQDTSGPEGQPSWERICYEVHARLAVRGMLCRDQAAAARSAGPTSLEHTRRPLGSGPLHSTGSDPDFMIPHTPTGTESGIKDQSATRKGCSISNMPPGKAAHRGRHARQPG